MRQCLLGVWLAAGIFGGVAMSAQVAAAPAPPTPAPDYLTDVKPVLQTNCYRCHGGLNHRGGLNIETRASLLKGGKSGVDVIPGDPEKSLLVRLIHHDGAEDDPRPMPPKSKLSDAEIAVIEQWIRAGALMPETPPLASSKP